MAAVAVTTQFVARIPKGIDETIITGIVAGAGTLTVPHTLGGIPIAAFFQPIAASGTVTSTVVSFDATNVVVEVSAACHFCLRVLSGGAYNKLA